MTTSSGETREASQSQQCSWHASSMNLSGTSSLRWYVWAIRSSSCVRAAVIGPPGVRCGAVGRRSRELRGDREPLDHLVVHRGGAPARSEEHTSELQSRQYLVCRLLLEKKKKLVIA